MRALIIYSQEGKLGDIARRLADKLQSYNCEAKLMQAEMSGSTPIPCAPYDVVCVGSPTLGIIGGKIAADIAPTVKRCTRLAGRNSVAFVKPKIVGTVKSLKKLMGELEKQGAMVQDFAAIGNDRDLDKFAQRIARLG